MLSGDNTPASSTSAAPYGGNVPKLKPFGNNGALIDALESIHRDDKDEWRTIQSR